MAKDPQAEGSRQEAHEVAELKNALGSKGIQLNRVQTKESRTQELESSVLGLERESDISKTLRGIGRNGIYKETLSDGGLYGWQAFVNIFHSNPRKVKIQSPTFPQLFLRSSQGEMTGCGFRGINLGLLIPRPLQQAVSIYWPILKWRAILISGNGLDDMSIICYPDDICFNLLYILFS